VFFAGSSPDDGRSGEGPQTIPCAVYCDALCRWGKAERSGKGERGRRSYDRSRVARGRDLVVQRGNRIFAGVGLPELAKKVTSPPRTHGIQYPKAFARHQYSSTRNALTLGGIGFRFLPRHRLAASIPHPISGHTAQLGHYVDRTQSPQNLSCPRSRASKACSVPPRSTGHFSKRPSRGYEGNRFDGTLLRYR
jgi:hypothetical protein